MRIPLVASIAFQAFSVKAFSIDEQAVRITNATEPLVLMSIVLRGDGHLGNMTGPVYRGRSFTLSFKR
jgi:hypothetical protein